ncbi:hypothetical protein [Micromonospora lupini]|uniref:hypothetical protein n=1 Tax=Micromonospora lupini TaxID=285679 RepID=UPI0033D1649E
MTVTGIRSKLSRRSGVLLVAHLFVFLMGHLMRISRNAWIIGFGVGVVAVAALAVWTSDDPAPTPPTNAQPVVASTPPTLAPSVVATSASTAVKTPATPLPHSPKPAGGPLGLIISTGMDASPISEWVIYGESISDKNAPRTTFGFVLGERHNNGTLTPYIHIHELTGPEVGPGFHVPEGPASLEGGIEQPAFGYFVGTAAKITGTVDGKTFVAKQAVWSKNAAVKVFWFDNTTVTGASTLTNVTAYDVAGKKIGQAQVTGVGQ